MTAISVVSTVLERLKYLEGHDRNPNNPNLLDELKDEVVTLQKELEKAREVLDETHTNREENEKVPEAEKQIIWLFYECEDVIEKHVQDNTDKLNGKTRFRNPLRNTKKTAIRDIRNLTIKIQELSDKCKTTGKLKHTTSGGKISNHGPLHRNHSVAMPRLNRLQTESLTDMEKKIKGVLDSKGRDLPIISIWGPRGSGKSTLAKKMYEEAKIANSFDSFTWFYIPVGFETKSMLLAILVQLCVQCEDDIKEMDDMELAQMLHKVLQQKKCLIVMDNMRSLDEWHSIRIAFPRETDSKVLLTTREEVVAKEASTTERAYKMMPLTEDESCELFMKKAKDDKGLPQEEMVKIGKEIVEHCAGSPLAIAIIGELMKATNFDEWEGVHNALKENIGQSFEQKLDKVLALSYCRLPHNLKTCFLYLGHFPDDQEIQVQTLYLLWMAEGIVPLNDATKNENTTEFFLYELAKRNFLEMEEEEEPKFRNFKTCRLHDLIRNLSVSKWKEEIFFEAVNGSKASSTPRLAIHLDKDYDGRCTFDESKVRSLLFFETHDSQTKSSWPPKLSDLKDIEWLRILHFDGVDIKARNLPKGLDKLAYLRYLSFFGCDLEKMPASISNLPYIQTLDLRVRGKMTIPNVLSKMKRLMHLYFPVVYVNEVSGKLSLDGLIELEILENFDTRVCHADDLSMFKKLRVLKVIAEGNINDLNVIVKCMKNNLSGLQLSSLDLRNFDCYSNERVSFIKSLPSLVALHILHVQGYIGKFPERREFSRSFIELALNGSELKEDPMPFLGKLPNLRSLILINDAYMGKQMECSNSHFPELRSLKLLHLNYLETCNVVEGSMPKLSTLTIQNCCSLLMLPPGLKLLKSLKGLKIVSMPIEFIDTIQLKDVTIVFEH